MAVGKQVAVFSHAKGWRTEPTRIFRHYATGIAFWCRDISRHSLLGIRRKINASMLAFPHDCHQLASQFMRFSMLFYISVRCNLTTTGTFEQCTPANFEGFVLLRTLARLHFKPDFVALRNRLHPCFVALLFGQHKRTSQRHLTATGGVGAFDGACPDPRNDGGLAAAKFMGYFYLGVQVPDAAEGLPLHPLAVILHISGKPLRSLPAPGGIQFGAAVRVDRRLPGKPGRDLDHGLVDHYRHRVQVVGVGFQPQPLGFQRDGTAARKGIQQGRRVVIGRAQDLRFGGVQHLRVVGVFPLDQLFQNGKQPLTLGVLGLLGGVQFRVGRGVVHKAGPYHSACRRQRTPCPPQVQGGRVPMTDGFFARCFRIDRFQRKGNFNQLFRH